MKLHFLQHVPFEDLAHIQIWADSKNITVSKTALYEKNPLFPSMDSFDMLVIMGGPMGVYDEDKYEWMADEKRFIDQAISNCKTVLGICLGAQMIASVAGARVFPNEHKEIGFFDVTRVGPDDNLSLLRSVPHKFGTFQWHGDTFDLPIGSIHLAKSDVCSNQAFQIGDRVLGLQFHLESTAQSIQKLIDNCGDELVKAPYIQTAEQIKSNFDCVVSINRLMESVMENLALSVV